MEYREFLGATGVCLENLTGVPCSTWSRWFNGKGGHINSYSRAAKKLGIEIDLLRKWIDDRRSHAESMKNGVSMALYYAYKYAIESHAWDSAKLVNFLIENWGSIAAEYQEMLRVDLADKLRLYRQHKDQTLMTASWTIATPYRIESVEAWERLAAHINAYSTQGDHE